MEIKKFSEYNTTEQVNLLMHWFHYYSKNIYTLEERTMIQQIIEQQPYEVLKIAVWGYLKNHGSQVLLFALRQDLLLQLFDTIPRDDEFNENDKMEFEELIAEFIVKIVDTYNNPEPDVPMDEETIRRQISAITKLDKDKKDNIFH